MDKAQDEEPIVFSSIKEMPELKIPLHSKRLEKALIYKLNQQKHDLRNLSYYLNLFSNMSTYKKFSMTGFAAFTLVLAVASFNIFTNISAVNAQTLLTQVSNKVSKLAPADFSNLEQRLKIDLKSILSEAKNAKDLKYCNKEQCILTQEVQITLNNQPVLKNKNLSLLEFTAKDSHPLLLGVDKNNLPQFVFSFHDGISSLETTAATDLEKNEYKVDFKDGSSTIDSTKTINFPKSGSTFYNYKPGDTTIEAVQGHGTIQLN